MRDGLCQLPSAAAWGGAGRRVFDAASGDKTFLTVPDTGHHSYVAAHRSEWTSAVQKLMKKVLLPEGRCEDERGEVFSGPARVVVDAPLDRLPKPADIPENHNMWWLTRP